MKKIELKKSPYCLGKYRRFIRILKLMLVFLMVCFIQVSATYYSPSVNSSFDKMNLQQQRIISGTVTDAEGRLLPGVTVVVKGTTQGTVTNSDGEYTLRDIPEDATLQFSFVGMQTRDIIVGSQTTIDIMMEEATIGLEEVVAIGYGVQKKENLTGSVAQINSDEIELRTVNNTTQALQGLSPNLNIDVNASGGEPDASMNINIRGIGSLSSSDPYILINGVRSSQQELASLNPNDIRDISVLKDAASSAIYGAQAAYGVILITTKEGKYEQDFEVSYSNSLRQKQRIFVPQAVNSLKYAEVMNAAIYNQSGQIEIGPEHMEKIRAYMDGDISNQTEQHPQNPNYWVGIESGASGGWFSGYANTNWWDVMFKDREFSHKHDLTVRGGGERIAYHISGGYFNDSGALNFGSEEYKRYNFNSNIVVDIFDWLNFSNNTRFTYENNIFPASLDAGNVNEDRGRFYHDAMRFAPLAPYKTPAVKDNEGNVIVPEQLVQVAGWAENNGFNEYNTNNLVSIFKAEIKILPGFFLKGDYSFKKNFYDRTMNLKKWTVYGPDGLPSIVYQSNNNQIQKDYRKTDYTSLNLYSNFETSVSEQHNFALLIGYQQEEQFYNRLQVSRQNVISDLLNSTNVAVGDVIGPANPISTWGTLGIFGRLTYNFKEKYLFEFNGRYDGSSKFESGRRFGFFPSLSAGYNLHREDFWDSFSNIFNSFKIRASVGKIGNQDVAGYLYMSTIPINTRLNWIVNGERPNYTSMPGIVSPNITWETSLSKNFGFDFSVFDGRLSGEFDIYDRKTENMFGPSSALPAALGTNPPRTNSASLVTKGWELIIGWRERASTDFNYNIKLMLSDNRSTITEYNNPNKVLSNWYVGQEIGEIWGFESDGLFQTKNEIEEYLSETDISYFGSNWKPGNVKYNDLNGDGKVNVGDNTRENPGDRKIIGNDQPRYRFSVSGGINWKRIDMHMLWQGVGKRDYMPGSYATLFWGWNRRAHTCITEASLDYWSEENPDAYLPLFIDDNSRNGFAKDRHPSTRYIQDASFVRLKSLSIGYSLPASLTERVNISGARISLSGENLFTLTKLWENFDPELAYVSGFRQGDGRAYPLAKVYSLGLNITF